MKPEKCTTCMGDGFLFNWVKCDYCIKDYGCMICDYMGIKRQIEKCSKCFGIGTILISNEELDDCPICEL